MTRRPPSRQFAVNGTSPKRAPASCSLAACTIISRNYLSHAKILAKSYARQEPGGRFYLLVVDRLPPGVDLGPHVQVVDPDELAIPHFLETCFKYDVTELCTAVKPAFLSLLLQRYRVNQVVYFDPDILILKPLDRLKKALQSGSIVLTPHLLQPIPHDGFRPSEQDILLAGAYNLGFIAVRKSAESMDLLQWWQEHLRKDCRVNPSNAVFVNQRWVNLVPGMFPSTIVLNDEAYNVAYWNIHSRKLERRGTQFSVNGQPLVFFHFSGFDPASPRMLSKHQNRTKVAEGTALAALLDMYAALHRENGHEKSGAGRMATPGSTMVYRSTRSCVKSILNWTRCSGDNSAILFGRRARALSWTGQQGPGRRTGISACFWKRSTTGDSTSRRFFPILGEKIARPSSSGHELRAHGRWSTRAT